MYDDSEVRYRVYAIDECMNQAITLMIENSRVVVFTSIKDNIISI
jgi:hypothetical protein